MAILRNCHVTMSNLGVITPTCCSYSWWQYSVQVLVSKQLYLADITDSFGTYSSFSPSVIELALFLLTEGRSDWFCNNMVSHFLLGKLLPRFIKCVGRIVNWTTSHLLVYYRIHTKYNVQHVSLSFP